MTELAGKFPYIFDPAFVVPAGTSKPELAPHVLEPGVTVSIAGVDVLPLAFPHGNQQVLGYRVGAMAYLTDVKTIPEDVIAALQGLEVLVSARCSRGLTHCICPFPKPWRRHSASARSARFTHLTHEFTHGALGSILPEGIAPAYDGLVIDVAGP
jgi:phosphoribosyl 1,2-cyclic phosphate phosphodiesterase